MPTVTIDFAEKLNTSVSVGDTAYFIGAVNISTPTGTTLESADSSDIVEIGEITSLDRNLQADTTAGSHIVCATILASGVVANNYYILFSKDNAASMSSILGYYAEVKMTNTNNSTHDAEMFQVGMDMFESSGHG